MTRKNEGFLEYAVKCFCLGLLYSMPVLRELSEGRQVTSELQERLCNEFDRALDALPKPGES
jgi:hypothetical protein